MSEQLMSEQASERAGEGRTAYACASSGAGIRPHVQDWHPPGFRCGHAWDTTRTRAARESGCYVRIGSERRIDCGEAWQRRGEAFQRDRLRRGPFVFTIAGLIC